MTYPQPNYEITRVRVEGVLTRLRSMFKSISGTDNYNQGLREGVRTASMAMKEELDATLRQTLAGPPVEEPSLAEVLAQSNVEQLQRLSEQMSLHDIELYQLREIAECEHEFDVVGNMDGDDVYGDCGSCRAPHEFLTALGWPVGTVNCQFCAMDADFCMECGRGLGE